MSDQTAPFFASGKHPVRRSGRTEDRTQTYTFVHGCLKILAQIDFSISNNTSASSVCKDREGGWFFIIIDKDHKSNVFPLGGECWVLFWTMRKEAVHSWSYTVNTQWYQTKIGPEFPALKLFGECATCQKENARPWESVGFVLWSWLIFTLALLFCFLSNDLLMITSQLVGCTTGVVFTGKKKKRVIMNITEEKIRSISF